MPILLVLLGGLPGRAPLPAAPLAAARAEGSAEIRELISRGDAAWARRAEGHRDDRAAPEPIAAAVAAYEEALGRDPANRDAANLEARWKLLRALYFQGEHAVPEGEAREAVFARGVEVLEGALEGIADRLRRAGIRIDPARASPEEIAAAIGKVPGGIPEAAAIYFWGGTNQGLWGDAHGRLAAARQGVGGKVRDCARVVILLDETYEYAGGHRLLGRLHTLAPWVPFFTAWVDREVAVAELRRAVELAPEDPFNVYYLADALARHAPGGEVEAGRLLRALLAAPRREANPVQDAKILADARRLLAELEAKGGS